MTQNEAILSKNADKTAVSVAYNPSDALQNLRERTMTNPELMADCHMTTHMIGHQAYRELGEQAYDHLDPLCGGGYLHGVIEQAFKQNGLDYLQNVVHDYCGEEMTEACLHGVGHGIHGVLGDTTSSVTACANLHATSTDCYDGVFMDAFDADGMENFEAPDLDVALNQCEQATKQAQPSCYFYIPRLLFTESKVISLCESSDILTGWGACAQGSGVHFMKTLANFDAELANEWCDLYTDPNLQTLCKNGVIAYEQHGSVLNTNW